MISELGAPTREEIDFLRMARVCGHVGGMQVLTERLRTLATRCVQRGLVELHIADDGKERARITSMAAHYLNRIEERAV